MLRDGAVKKIIEVAKDLNNPPTEGGMFAQYHEKWAALLPYW
jgi:hypothetical protein